jgi:hypothetical protein
MDLFKFLSNFALVIGIYSIILWCFENFSTSFELLVHKIKSFYKQKMTLKEEYGEWAGSEIKIVQK